MQAKTICPCCRREVEGALPREQLAGLFLSAFERKFIQRLARDAGRIVTRKELIDALWGERSDGGPDDTSSALGGFKYRTKNTLQFAGWRVISHKGRGFSLEIEERK